MITKELFFKYNLNYQDIYNLTLENNEDFIKVIPEIIYYNKGIWNNNKRIDKIKINISDIPYDLRNIIDMMRDKNGYIGIKIKIQKELIDNKIFIKTKLKLNGIMGSLINNSIKLSAKFDIIDINNNTEINVNYKIKSFLFNELNDRINNHIQSKLENYYIKNIDNYFKKIKND